MGVGKVIPILKKRKVPSDPTSYRPISLLPNWSKVFEIVINQQLIEFCDKEKILPNCQFGFRYQHSTTHTIHKVTSDICWALNDNEFLGACLIDLEKAFDSVWIEGLLYRLLQKNFPTNLVKIYKAYESTNPCHIALKLSLNIMLA